MGYVGRRDVRTEGKKKIAFPMKGGLTLCGANATGLTLSFILSIYILQSSKDKLARYEYIYIWLYWK